jgi:hypothetical protein
VPAGSAGDDAYLNELNAELLSRLETGGDVFLSNALVDDRFYLRACIVNFRTTADDVRALTALVRRIGADVHADLCARA